MGGGGDADPRGMVDDDEDTVRDSPVTNGNGFDRRVVVGVAIIVIIIEAHAACRESPAAAATFQAERRRPHHRRCVVGRFAIAIVLAAGGLVWEMEMDDDRIEGPWKIRLDDPKSITPNLVFKNI